MTVSKNWDYLYCYVIEVGCLFDCWHYYKCLLFLHLTLPTSTQLPSLPPGNKLVFKKGTVWFSVSSVWFSVSDYSTRIY